MLSCVIGHSLFPLTAKFTRTSIAPGGAEGKKVGFWHIADLRRAAHERPFTSGLPTLGAEGPGIGMDNLSYFESAEFLEGAIFEGRDIFGNGNLGK